MTIYNPKNCLKYSGKLKNINDCINSITPTISSIKRETGEKFTFGLIQIWIVYLNKVLDLKNPMNEEQIDLCTETILSEFYALKVTDLTFVFKRIISGYYGKFYERLSISDILRIFNEYFNERCNIAEQESLRVHNDIKSDQTFAESKNIKRILMDKK